MTRKRHGLTGKTIEESLPEITVIATRIFEVLDELGSSAAVAVCALAYVNGYSLGTMSDDVATANRDVLVEAIWRFQEMGAAAGLEVRARSEKQGRPTKAATVKAAEDLLKRNRNG